MNRNDHRLVKKVIRDGMNRMLVEAVVGTLADTNSDFTIAADTITRLLPNSKRTTQRMQQEMERIHQHDLNEQINAAYNRVREAASQELRRKNAQIRHLQELLLLATHQIETHNMEEISACDIAIQTGILLNNRDKQIKGSNIKVIKSSKKTDRESQASQPEIISSMVPQEANCNDSVWATYKENPSIGTRTMDYNHSQ